MLRETRKQVREPRPVRRWPQVANRHRRAAMDEAQEIIDLIDKDFIELLDEEVSEDLDEAIMCLRHNPGKALRHLQLAQRSIETIVRSAQLVHKRAETIFTVLDSAPADEEAA